MREALFVKQNSGKWKRYEQMEAATPDELAERFVEITNDLAYAKTFYPQSKTTAYLNGAASLLHQSIYKNKRERSSRILKFWTAELPQLFYKHRLELLYAFIFFMVFNAVGVLSAAYDDTFVRLIMGDAYVNMTLENIAAGDPFGVYKRSGEIAMFLRIAANNVQVCLMTFVAGIFFSIGTLGILLRNGVMIGSFHCFFFSQGLGAESILVIWIHGVLEISAIILSGAAGLVLGRGLLFPETYNRRQAFMRGAKEGIKIAIGIVPIVIAAAFLEGFVTRHTEMPLGLSISILALSFIFILWYVVIYPWKLAKKTKTLYHAKQD
ncbi:MULTISPECIES: stage II sporulation protein M [Pedobacter]|uniref:stage II sporulation protein M n=1 Tax=Pedobacter TaxID=84567 RepID=UPI00210EC855|nr:MULTISPECIES: stage II sporulation protein M [unclassified Pedobacter]